MIPLALLLLQAAPDLHEEARFLHRQGRYAQAEVLPRRALEDRTDDPVLLLDLGLNLALQNKLPEAQATLSRLLTLTPDSIPALQALAQVHLAGEETAAAEALLLRAISVRETSHS
jgi:Tfp pilus assembly protein PilF